MKIRTGFVSNSSATSFTCDVCGENQCGQDLCLSECDMYQCVNGHTFCGEHLRKTELDLDSNYDTPAEVCPICNFESLSEREFLFYFLRKNDTTEKAILEKMKSEFKDYDEFRKFIGPKGHCA